VHPRQRPLWREGVEIARPGVDGVFGESSMPSNPERDPR